MTESMMPNVIPDDLPDQIMMMMVMVAPAAMPGVNLDDLPDDRVVGRGVLAGGMQVQLNCPLEIAVIGLRGLLASMERDLARQHSARTN